MMRPSRQAPEIQSPPAGEAAGTAEDDGEHAGHVQGVVASQEDVGPTREAGDDDVQDHAQSHDDGGVGAELLECVGDNCLVVGDDALHIEGIVKDLAKREQRVGLQERRACRQNQEADDRLERALDDFLNWLAL
jgi:hypothetical protein